MRSGGTRFFLAPFTLATVHFFFGKYFFSTDATTT
jgi:hypothetical protein